MGQYHKVYNIDKKEYFRADFLKLKEQVGTHGSTTALFMLVANSNGRGGGDFEDHFLIGSWAGNRIVVQGDYAEPNDSGFIPDKELDGYINISEKVWDMVETGMKGY
jgi:hypothetical protein